MVPDEKKELEEPHNYFISELICLKLFHGDKSERVSICNMYVVSKQYISKHQCSTK